MLAMAFSNNGDYELLIDQITDAIVARLNGDGGEQVAMCGCTSECFHRCPERMHRIVDAGAARIGLVLGQTGNAREWAGLIDHTPVSYTHLRAHETGRNLVC